MQTPSFARRNTLNQIIKLSLFGAIGIAGMDGLIQDALAKGDAPPTAGINTFKGDVTVNGEQVKIGTPVKMGDRIKTGAGSTVVIVLGRDAFMLRQNTDIEFKASAKADTVLDTVLISTGKMLAVFEKASRRNVDIKTRVATIGIRGTGAYIETQGDKTYMCLCYGAAAVTTANTPTPEMLASDYHLSNWVSEVNGTMKIEKAPFADHSDAELTLLESLVGRKPPFEGKGYPSAY
jgi:hypothetical protein